MTTNSIAPLAEFIEDGVTLIHPIDFKFLAAADLYIERIVGDTVIKLSEGVDFVATGEGLPTGGSVRKFSPGVAGSRLRVRRFTLRKQNVDYAANDTFPAESHEGALDRAMLIAQELGVSQEDLMLRAVTASPGDVAPNLPPLSALAGKALGGSADGASLVPITLGGADAALRLDLVNPAAGAALIAADNGPYSIPANAKDTMRWVARGDARTYGAGSVTMDVVVARATAAGVRDLLIPEGEWNTDNVLVIGSIRIRGAGRGVTKLNGITSAGVVAFIGGIGGTLEDLSVYAHNSAGAGFAIGTYNLSPIIRARMARIDVGMDQTTEINGCRIDGGQAGINGFVQEDLFVDHPTRMGNEILCQGGAARIPFKGFECRGYTCDTPFWKPQPTFAPMLSIDGLIDRPVVRRLTGINTPGTAVELIETNRPLIEDVDLFAPRGALLVASNALTVDQPEIRRLRKVTQAPGGVPVNVLAIPSASGAIIDQCECPLTILRNAQAPFTRVLNSFFSSDGAAVIENNGGAGGGAGMQVVGGMLDLSLSRNATAVIDFGANTGQSSVVGVKMRAGKVSVAADAADSPYIGGINAGAVAAANNILTNAAGTATVIGSGQ